MFYSFSVERGVEPEVAAVDPAGAGVEEKERQSSVLPTQVTGLERGSRYRERVGVGVVLPQIPHRQEL